jgi:hypothetical protein
MIPPTPMVTPAAAEVEVEAAEAEVVEAAVAQSAR